ncbi:hypothetical protein C4J81_17500 [Deltaproteobacteria bacterium Smac51]|nr:hypothetical protein C4J81_17500 [Deltaproteobacteria bacterium Smac51]
MSFQTMRLIIELTLSLHFFIRCRVAFGGGWWQLPVLLWLVIMIVPQTLQGLDVLPEPVMGILLKIWPVWAGYLILFLVAALGLDLLRLLAGLAGAASGHSWWSSLAAKRAVPAALALSAVIAVYSYYTAYNPSLKHVVFQTGKLPEDVDSLRIVQLTDVHLSSLIVHDDLKKMTDLAISAKPDILVVTGDLVDTDMRGRDSEAALLAAVKPRYGSYAVMGNHEYYRGVENSLGFMEKAGLNVLRGEGLEAGGIIVAGVDDEAFRNSLSVEPVRMLRDWYSSGLFVLFLKHRPSPIPGTSGFYDLQLSGHTHGGQMWPGHILIKKVNGYLSGLYRDPGGKSFIYTSNGSGFWGMPLRFLAPPEVTLIELVRKEPEKI